MIKLSSLTKGASARIVQLPSGDIRVQLIRLGLMEGAVVNCIQRLPGGTMILGHHRQELALSTELAESISIANI
jgi:Fe2+ transport system protein FeoA